jgi:transcription antitermination factor NusG
MALPLSYPGIVGVIRNDGVPAPISDAEISAVRRFATGVSATGDPPGVVDYEEIALGTRVLITAGPFKGLSGILLETRGKGCVAVQIEAIRQVRAVRLNLAAVMPHLDGEGDESGATSLPTAN